MNWNYKWNLNLSLILLAAHVSGATAKETPLPPGKPVNIDFKSDYRIRSTPGGDRVVSLIRDVKQKHQKIKLTGKKQTANGRRWVEVSYGRKTGWISAYAVDRHLNIQSTQVAQRSKAPAPAKVKVADSKPLKAPTTSAKPSPAAPQTSSSLPAAAPTPIKLASATAPAPTPVQTVAAKPQPKPEPKNGDTGKFGAAPKPQIDAAPATAPVPKKAEPAPRKLEVASARVAPKDEKSVEPKKTEKNKPEQAKKETKPNEKPIEAAKKEETKPAEKPKVADKPAPAPARKLECAKSAKELALPSRKRLAEALEKSKFNPFGVWKAGYSDLYTGVGDPKGGHVSVHRGWDIFVNKEKHPNPQNIPTAFEACVEPNSDVPYLNIGGVQHHPIRQKVYLEEDGKGEWYAPPSSALK